MAPVSTVGVLAVLVQLVVLCKTTLPVSATLDTPPATILTATSTSTPSAGLVLRAEFQQMSIESLREGNVDVEQLTSAPEWRAFHAWRKPSQSRQEYPLTAFEPLLSSLRHGVPRAMQDTPGRELVGQAIALEREAFLPFLQQLHPRATTNLRFAGSGAFGVIRAVSAQRLELQFRVHAEFHLHSPDEPPFYFTPSQFAGSIVVSRTLDRVLAFDLAVPASRNGTRRVFNVDLEWVHAHSSHADCRLGVNVSTPVASDCETRVGIGFIEVMRLVSVDAELAQFEEVVHGLATNTEAEISSSEAERLLENEFYPFMRAVRYITPLELAYTQAQQELKRVHVVLLWGALDDSSC